MNDYTNFRIALNEIVRILSPHSRPDAKRAMASKLATAARGEVIENLSFRYSDIGHIFFPDNEPAALVLTEQISTARQSGELASIIPIGDGLLPTDLITWPACPLVSAKNPLSYWLPVTTAPSGAPESDKPNARPLPAQRFQENEILRVIHELGYVAKALPKSEPGKKGVKAEVRKIVPLNSTGIFDGAWERLRATGEIKDAT